MAARKSPPSELVAIRLTPAQIAVLRASGKPLSDALRDRLAKADPEFAAAPAPRPKAPARPAYLDDPNALVSTLDANGKPITCTNAQADELYRRYGSTAQRLMRGGAQANAPAPKLTPEQELAKLRAEAYAGLNDVQKAQADKLSGAHRARFIRACQSRNAERAISARPKK